MEIIRKGSMISMLQAMKNKKGSIVPMEMVQVAILIALAVALGVIFKTEITQFVNKTFAGLNG